jgi:hypothetical protein
MAQLIGVGHIDDHPAVRDAIRSGFDRAVDIRLATQGSTARDIGRMLVRISTCS